MDNFLEKLAMAGERMPDGLPLTEQKFFQTMSYLYARFRGKMISQEAASQEKKQAYMALKTELKEETFRDNHIYHSERLNRLTETAKAMCRKNPSAESALELCDILDGINTVDILREAIKTDYGANCPVCGKFFNQDHADRKPNFCEACGCRLGWGV
jgi:hypothetical protein